VTPYGAAKAAAETAVKCVIPDAVIARTSLIVGDGDSKHEKHKDWCGYKIANCG
jgi:dTDP-4-dehydrorhamnose reductase